MIPTCEDGRWKGGCETCDAAAGSQTYRELECGHVNDPGTEAWMDWFKAHHIPASQVPWKCWVARDVERRTVSVKVHAWSPEDEARPEFGVTGIVSTDRDDAGHWASKDARYGVHTVQLDFAPLPFPPAGTAPAPTDAEKEILVKLDQVIELLADPLDFIRDALEKAAKEASAQAVWVTAPPPVDAVVEVQPALELDL
jgi:hypothetical protein